MKMKMGFAVGQKVRGYGMVNEFGEFDFIPEQTGVRSGNIKLVKQGENFTVSTTKKAIIVHVRLTRANGLPLLKEFSLVMNQLLNILREYEF